MTYNWDRKSSKDYTNLKIYDILYYCYENLTFPSKNWTSIINYRVLGKDIWLITKYGIYPVLRLTEELQTSKYIFHVNFTKS